MRSWFFSTAWHFVVFGCIDLTCVKKREKDVGKKIVIFFSRQFFLFWEAIFFVLGWVRIVYVPTDFSKEKMIGLWINFFSLNLCEYTQAIQNFQIASDTSGLPYWKFEKTQRKFLVPQKNFNSKNRATRVIVILVKVTPFEKLRKLTSKNLAVFLTSKSECSVLLYYQVVPGRLVLSVRGRKVIRARRPGTGSSVRCCSTTCTKTLTVK